MKNAIDLEAIAHHRGSSFGQHLSPQPSQADFENRLACAMITHAKKGFSHMILEDEGRHIGKRYLPKSLSSYFSSCPLVLLETSFEQRTQVIYDEYVIHLQEQYITSFGLKKGLQIWLKEMGSGAGRIRKRLGSLRHQQLIQLQELAYQHQLQTGYGQEHKGWIRLLLGEYYDPMYDYQLKNRSELIVFTGDISAVTEYLVNLEPYSDGRH
jgi:tRNA 2-selenouridine synthase